jgi:Family of unknown function (DUF5709)
MGQNDESAEGVDQWNMVEDDGVLDASDTLDDDRVSDPLDTGVAAPDRWAGANRFGTTPAEERAGESLEQRLAQEERDIDPYAELDGDRDEDELTRHGYQQEARAGRLVADDQGVGGDEEPDAVAHDAGIDGGGASAEEAAIHVIDEPDDLDDGPLR